MNKTLESIVKTPLTWYIIAGIIALIVIKKILSRIGIIKSEESKANEAKLSNPSTFFSPNYHFKQKVKGKILNNKELDTISKTIYQSFHGSTATKIFTVGMAEFGTDEQKFFGAIQQIKSKIQMSQIVERYYKNYTLDLLADIQSELDDKELSKFFNYAEKLPNYA